MINLDSRFFEKIAVPLSTIERFLSNEQNSKKLLSGFKNVVTDRLKVNAVDATKEKVLEQFEKGAGLGLPKVDKTALIRSKKITTADPTSHSLRKAIDSSKMPKKVLTEVRRSTEQMYMGGNTAENLRGVIRSEEKSYRDDLKRRFNLGKKLK